MTITTAPRESLTEPPPEPEPLSSFELLPKRLLSSARIVGFGESNHGTGDYTLQRANWAVQFAADSPVVVLTEASFGDALPSDTYVRTGNGDAATASKSMAFWMWKTHEYVAALDLLRAYNRSAPQHSIQIVGIDVQRTATLIPILEKSVPLASEVLRSTLGELSSANGESWTAMDAPKREAILAFLQQFKIRKGAGIDANRVALAALCLRLRLELWDAKDDADAEVVRDAGMASMVAAVADAVPDARLLIWAHLEHLAKQYNPGSPPLGARLSQLFGAAYRVIALSTTGGTVISRPPDGGALATFRIEAVPAYTVEGALGRGLGAMKGGFVLFEDLSGVWKRWLATLRLTSEFGAYFAAGTESMTVVEPLASFDGMAVFADTAASEPLPPESTP